MANDESVLEHCNPAFARSWGAIDAALPLLAGFVDALAVVAFQRNGMARVVLEGPGFAALFGDGCAQDANFFIRADRQDRDSLVSACRSARSQGSSVHVDVAWDAAGGIHAADDDNFFKTVVSVEHVGALDGEALLYLAFRDVSEQRTAQHSLARSQFSSALRALFDEIFLLNLDTGASEPVYAGGKPLENEDGTPISCGFHAMFTTVHRDDAQLFWKYSNYIYVETELFGPEPVDAITFDLRRRDDAGAFHWSRVYISRIPSSDGRKNVLVCSQNIDEQKDAQRRERELRSKAQTDGLTGIYNRGTSEELARAKLQGLASGDAAVLAIVDVDDFKRVNDTYGHQVGDEVLRSVAGALRGACRDDDIVGRMGGDEFTALFASAGEPDRDDLRARLERCKDRVREQSAELGVDPPVTLSIGAVVAAGGDSAYNEVFERADRLLYDVKRSGKDALRFE